MRVIPLKDGSARADPRADRLYEHDDRNANYPVSEVLPDRRRPKLRSYTWRVTRPLDQRFDGACVGFAWAHEMIARPREITGVDETFARETLYMEAQKRDRWPGGEYDGANPLMAGTSVLACAKVVKDLGYIREYRWAASVWELASAIGFLGPAVIGCDLFEEMRDTDDEGFIRPEGTRLGGHALLVMGARIRPVGDAPADPDQSSFLLQNSWGEDWGRGGRCRITFTDMERLWESVEACIPVGREDEIETA